MYFTPAFTFSVPAARVGLGAAVFPTPPLKAVFVSKYRALTPTQKAAYKKDKRKAAAAPSRPDKDFELVATKGRARSRRSREDLARGDFVDDAHLNPFSGRLSKRKVLDAFSAGRLTEVRDLQSDNVSQLTSSTIVH